MRNRLSFLLVLLACGNLAAQPEFDYNSIKSNHPLADTYFLSNKKNISIEIKDNKLELICTDESSLLYLNDKASSLSSKSIYYYEEMEDVYNIHAASYVPDDKGKYRKTEVEEIFSQKPLKDNIFYDDYKEFFFRYPGLKNKAVSTLSYNQKFKDPHFLDPFYFGDNSPVGLAEFTVTFPKEVEMQYFMGGDTSGIEFTRTETKKNITFSWKAKNVKAYSGNYSSYSIRRVLPHVIVYIKKYEIDGKTTRVLSNTQDLYNWYYNHISDLIKQPDPAVQYLADSLTKGMTDNTEKIKQIYCWVQENIKYIAFEQGLGGYVPRPAELVCSRRYGDCKDKSSLLYALLKASGIHSNLTWVGTRDIPYSYDQLPSPLVDNHMILSIKGKDGWTFLDGTSAHLALGLPSYGIQGKEALISLGPDSFLIVRIPEVPNHMNHWTDSISFQLTGNDLDGNGTSFLTGLMKSRMVNLYFDQTASKKDDEVKKLFMFGNNKCKTDIVGYKNDQWCEDTTFCYYKFSLPGYSSGVGEKKFINLHLVKDLHGDQLDSVKVASEQSYLFKSVHRRVITCSIPEEWRIVNIPPDAEWKSDRYSFLFHYRSQPGKVILETQVSINTLTIPLAAFPNWNEMVDAAENAYTEVVTLEKITK